MRFRYLAVCRPYEYRIAASTQTITSRVLKLTLPTLILAVIINIPKFFETELVEVSHREYIYSWRRLNRHRINRHTVYTVTFPQDILLNKHNIKNFG